jgi:hypothetical protein
MTELSFQPPPLSQADEALINVYQQTGLTVDQLAYTAEFDRLCAQLGRNHTQDEKREIYRRLLTLRKQGRLPRSYAESA